MHPQVGSTAVKIMSEHVTHQAHERVLGRGCGHTAVKHDGHGDYLQDGHLHHDHQGPCDEHAIETSTKNPDALAPKHDCQAHAADHQHGPGCGREALPRGDHADYFVEGHLHRSHGDHCDDHGP